LTLKSQDDPALIVVRPP